MSFALLSSSNVSVGSPGWLRVQAGDALRIGLLPAGKHEVVLLPWLGSRQYPHHVV